jgi:hypothetical protein
VDLRGGVVLCDPPRQCVLARTRADDEDVHGGESTAVFRTEPSGARKAESATRRG